MNVYQKMIIAAGGVLAALRVFFPVKYTKFLGMRFEARDDMGMFQNVDWGATGLHLGGIVILTVVLVLVFKKK